MELKPGVDPTGVQGELLLALIVAERIIERMAGAKLIITSLRDGQHSAGSLHYQGKAADVRTRDIEEKLRAPVAEEIARMLGAKYDVVLEGDHLHIEFDPKP